MADRFRRRYAGKDRQTLISDVKSLLRTQFEPKGINFDFSNDLNSLLLEQVALVGENVNFFQDLQINDSFLRTVQSKTGLDRQVASRGYNPSGAVPSAGSLTVAPSTAQPNAILLPQGFEWIGPDGLIFQTTQDYVFPAGSTDPQSINLTQQASRNANFASNGGRFQRLPLGNFNDNEFLTHRSVTVVINGEEWEERDTFLDTDTTVFRVAYTASPPFIEFGDGAVGEVPPIDAGIAVTYTVTRGEGGIIEAGQITGPVQPFVLLGNAVSFTVDETTGQMTGGLGPESSDLTRARAPGVILADNAVITDQDFLALVETFRDPVFGGVAAAGQVLATSIENDTYSLARILSIQSSLTEQGNVITDVNTALDAIQADVSANLSSMDTDAAQIITDTSPGSDIQTNLASIEQARVTTNNSANNILSEASFLNEDVSDVYNFNEAGRTNSDDIRTLITAIGSGGTIDPASYASLLILLDQLDGNQLEVSNRSSASSSTIQRISSISTDATSVKSQMTTVETELGEIQVNLTGLQSIAANIQTTKATADANLALIDAQQDVLTNTFVDPYNQAISDLTDLKNHLDNVFADVCGPNLVSVNILANNADGFYTAPTNGLIDAVQSYVDDRKEESVTFAVQSGDPFLVTPQITVTFQEVSGTEPLKVKAGLETQIFTLSRGREFGAALNLDDLYNQAQGVSDIVKANFLITGFTGSPILESFIDGDGNLIIQDREVITRPQLTFFRLLPDGTKESI